MKGLERLATIRNISVQKGKNWVHKDIFRLFNKEDLWVTAYENIYSKAPIEKTTFNEFDEFKLKTLNEIKESVINESYCPNCIQTVDEFKQKKKVNKQSETFIDKDKIVIEMIRIILEAIFEPLVFKSNFGCVQNKNAHITLQYIEEKFSSCDVIIQGECINVYKAIDNNILSKIINNYIEDNRFNNLLRKFLKIGILTSKTLEMCETKTLKTLLVNIYLYEFDQWAEITSKNKISELSTVYTKKKAKRVNSNELEINFSNSNLRKSITKIHYVRYTKDWIIGIEGDISLVIAFKKEIEDFFVNKLNVLSVKTKLICLSKGHLFFLDYTIYLPKSNSRGKITITDYKQKNLLRFEAPISQLLNKLKEIGVIKSIVKGYKPISKTKYTILDDHLIVLHFKSIWSAINKYYSGTTKPQRLQYIQWLLLMSCAMTLAHKHKSTCKEIFKRKGKSLTIEIPNRKRKVFFETNELLKKRKWRISEEIINPFKIIGTKIKSCS